MKWLQHLLDTQMQGMICCKISFCSSVLPINHNRCIYFMQQFYSAACKVYAFAQLLTSLRLQYMCLQACIFIALVTSSQGSSASELVWDAAAQLFFVVSLHIKIHTGKLRHTLTQIYTCTYLPCIFTSVAYIILETSQDCCIEKSTENSERDIFHFFITTQVVLLQVEDLLHSLTPSALLKKI